MQWNIPELCFCSNNTLTLQFCSPFSTLHYSRSFYIALCTLHFALCTLHFAHCTLHFAHCTLHFAFCTLHCSRYFCNVLGTLHLFQTLLYPSYYFALFQNTLVYPLYYILLYLKHSYVSVQQCDLLLLHHHMTASITIPFLRPACDLGYALPFTFLHQEKTLFYMVL